MDDAETDFARLTQRMLELATRRFADTGEFSPLGLALDPAGAESITVVSDEDGDAATLAALRDLRKDFRADAADGDLRSTAIASVVTVTLPNGDEKSVFRISLEHTDTTAQLAEYPYELIDGKVRFGEPVLQAAEAEIFVAKTA